MDENQTTGHGPPIIIDYRKEYMKILKRMAN
jgi:hypothetical protein